MIKRFFSGLFGARSNVNEPRVGVPSYFPFEVVETSGANALAKWEELKKAGRGVPVIVGNDFRDVAHVFDPGNAGVVEGMSVSESLVAARAIRFPEDFLKMRREAEADIPEDELAELQPEQGEWPVETPASPGLSVSYDVLTGQAHPCVYIVLVPTDDPTTIPAHLRWGNFNGCPSPEYHVAALRHWRDRYGAELVGMDLGTLNVRVTRKPGTREEALDLARLQYDYCSDIVDQGVESISALAAMLMAHEWWYFWWD